MTYHKPDDMLRCAEAVDWTARIMAAQHGRLPPFWKGLPRELRCFALAMYRLGRRDAFGVLEAAMREDELAGKEEGKDATMA